MSAQAKRDVPNRSDASRQAQSAPPTLPGEQTASQMTKAQRAAIVIALLGEASAKPIVEKLDDFAMSQIAEGLETIAVLPKAAQIEVAMDFLGHLRRASGALRGGRLQAREIMGSLMERDRLISVMGNPAREEAEEDDEFNVTVDVWTRLSQREASEIATYLDGLSPNLLALILSRLDVAFASKVLTDLSEDKLLPVMSFMVDVAPVDEGITQVIERMIEIQFLNVASDTAGEDKEHLAALGELLSLVPDSKREMLMSFLRKEHESELQAIEKVMFTIDALPEILPRNNVAVVFRELGDPEMLALLSCLTGPKQPIADFLLSNISSRIADGLREELADMATPSGEQVDQIQQDFLVNLMTLKRRGVVELEPAS
ncbi:MAG: FliG C-terminal domain-containing protein [Pseudomonadota bacterium]